MHKYVDEIVGISNRAVDAIEKGDVNTLAEAMHAAQQQFDTCCLPNCPSQLTAPVLHSLIDDHFLRSICLAVKGVGSQGDGSAQVLCVDAVQQQQVLDYIRNERKMDGFLLTIPPSIV